MSHWIITWAITLGQLFCRFGYLIFFFLRRMENADETKRLENPRSSTDCGWHDDSYEKLPAWMIEIYQSIINILWKVVQDSNTVRLLEFTIFTLTISNILFPLLLEFPEKTHYSFSIEQGMTLNLTENSRPLFITIFTTCTTLQFPNLEFRDQIL